MIETGQIIPKFSLPTAADPDFSDQSLRGKFAIIYFYPKDNTSGCTLEAQNFRDRYDEFQSLDAEVLGISRDSIKSHEKFSAKHDFTFPLGSDKDERVCNLFQVMKEKKMYGKTYLGIERSTFLINPDGKLVKQWRKVKVKGHVDEVLESLKDAAGSPS